MQRYKNSDTVAKASLKCIYVLSVASSKTKNVSIFDNCSAKLNYSQLVNPGNLRIIVYKGNTSWRGLNYKFGTKFTIYFFRCFRSVTRGATLTLFSNCLFVVTHCTLVSVVKSPYSPELTEESPSLETWEKEITCNFYSG